MKSTEVAFGAIVNNNKKQKQKLRAERHKTKKRVGYIGDGVWCKILYSDFYFSPLLHIFTTRKMVRTESDNPVRIRSLATTKASCRGVAWREALFFLCGCCTRGE